MKQLPLIIRSPALTAGNLGEASPRRHFLGALRTARPGHKPWSWAACPLQLLGICRLVSGLRLERVLQALASGCQRLWFLMS